MASPLILQLNSQNHWLSDGVQTNWNFSFAGGYINKSHIKAYHQSPLGVRTDITIDVDNDFVGPYQLVLPAVTAGYTLVIYRDTPKDVPLVDFSDGANIDEVSLDIVAQQGVFVAAETADFLGSTSIGDVIDLVQQAAQSSNDAVAAAAVAASHEAAADNSATAAATSASNASTSEAQALAYATASNGSAAAATTAAGAASSSASAASGSASAASSSAGTAAAAVSTASGHATNAGTSASNAANSAIAATNAAGAASGSAIAASNSATAALASATDADGFASAADASAIAAAASAAAAGVAGGVGGPGTTYQTPTRALATAYLNSTGKPILVSLSGISYGGSPSQGGLSLYCSPTVGPLFSSMVVNATPFANAGGYITTVDMIVPDGHYYAGNITGVLLFNTWFELSP